MMNVLDELFGGTPAEKMSSWDQEAEQKKANSTPGKQKFIRSYNLKDKEPDNVGLVYILNEGVTMPLHVIQERGSNGGKAFIPYLCKGHNCELCQTGKEPSIYGVYALVDLLHSYTDKNGKVVSRPTVKYFYKGRTVVKLLEKNRMKIGGGTLRNRKWEVTRTGTGPQTIYTFMPEEESIPDFTKMITIQSEGHKDGLQVPLISTPTWPDYDMKLKPEDQSIYQRQDMKPKHDIDWSNLDHVNLFLKLHFLSMPQANYRANGISGSTPSNEQNSTAQNSKDFEDVPF